MDRPDPADGISRLVDLIDDDLYSHVDPTNRAAVIGWGLFFAVAHQIRAVLELHRVGACGAASPNRRTALEYAVTLRWCLDRGDRIADIYNRKLGSDQIQLANALRAAGSSSYPEDAYQIMVETVKIVNETIPPDPDERLAKIEHLLDGYGLLGLKAYYQLESRFVHPTLTGAQMFFTVTSEATVLSQQPIHEELVPCEPLALNLLHSAMLAFNGLLESKPWSSELLQIAAEYDLENALPTWRSSSP